MPHMRHELASERLPACTRVHVSRVPGVCGLLIEVWGEQTMDVERAADITNTICDTLDVVQSVHSTKLDADCEDSHYSYDCVPPTSRA